MATVNLNDERLQSITNNKNSTVNMITSSYDNQISQSDEYYNKQIEAANEYSQKQTELQQAQTDYAIKQIETQKEDTTTDYNKEQKAAYTDYMKQNNAYGYSGSSINRDRIAGSGAAASIQASYYNSYQQRYATARESYDKAIRDYNSSITNAQLQNNATLAEIAYKTQQQVLQLSQTAFQYKNELLNNKTNALLQVTEHYDNLWQQMYNSLLSEAQERERMELELKNYMLKLEELRNNTRLSQAQLAETIRHNKASEAISRSSASSYYYPSYSDTSGSSSSSKSYTNTTKANYKTIGSSSSNKTKANYQTTKVSSSSGNWLSNLLNWINPFK